MNHFKGRIGSPKGRPWDENDGKFAKTKNKLKGLAKGLFDDDEGHDMPNAPLGHEDRGGNRLMMIHSNSSSTSHVSSKSLSFTGRKKDNSPSRKGLPKKGRGTSPVRDAAYASATSIGTPTLVSASGLGIAMKLQDLPALSKAQKESLLTPGARSTLSDYFPHEPAIDENGHEMPFSSPQRMDQSGGSSAKEASGLFRQDFDFDTTARRKVENSYPDHNDASNDDDEVEWNVKDIEQRFDSKRSSFSERRPSLSEKLSEFPHVGNAKVLPASTVAKRLVADKKHPRQLRQSIYENSLTHPRALGNGSGTPSAACSTDGHLMNSAQFPTFSTKSVIVPDKKRYITSLAANPHWQEAPYLAIGSGSGELFLYKDTANTSDHRSATANLNLVHSTDIGGPIHTLEWGSASMLMMSMGGTRAKIFNVDVPHLEGGGQGLELVQELSPLGPHRLNGMRFMPQDQARTACGVTNDAVLLWDVASAEIVADWHSPVGRICSMDISKVTPELVAIGTAESHIVCFDGRIPDADQPSWRVSDAHDGPVRSISFNPFVGWWMATGGDDGIINIWDTRYAKTTARPVLSLEGHANRVNCLVWSNTHISMLASGSADRSFRMWSLQEDHTPPQSVGLTKTKSQKNASSTMTRSMSTMSNVSVASTASTRMRGVWQLSKAKSAAHRNKEVSSGGIQIGEWRSHHTLASDSAVIAMDILPARQNTFFATTSHGEVSCHALHNHALDSLCPHRYPEGSKGYQAESMIFERSMVEATELIADWLKQESEGKLARTATAPIELVDTVVRGPLEIEGDDTPYDDITDIRAGHAEALERFGFELKETQWTVPAGAVGSYATMQRRQWVELMTTYADVKHMARTNAWEEILSNLETIREGVQLSVEVFKPALLEACILSVFRHNHVAALQFTSDLIDAFPDDADLRPFAPILHALNFPAIHDMYDEADRLSTEQILAVCEIRSANVARFRLDDSQARVNIDFENAIAKLSKKEIISILLMEAHFSSKPDFAAMGHVKKLSQRSALMACEAQLKVSNVITFAKDFTSCQTMGATMILLNRMLRHVSSHCLPIMKSYFESQLTTRHGYFDPSISLQAEDSVPMWQDKVIACCWVVQWLPRREGYSEHDHEAVWDWDSIEMTLATLLRKYIELVDNVPVAEAKAYVAALTLEINEQKPRDTELTEMLQVILRKLVARYEQKADVAVSRSKLVAAQSFESQKSSGYPKQITPKTPKSQPQSPGYAGHANRPHISQKLSEMSLREREVVSDGPVSRNEAWI